MGQVTLTTTEYNAIMKENMELKNLFSVRKDHWGTLEVHVDGAKALEVMPELIRSVDASKYTVRSLDDVYGATFAIADKIEEQPGDSDEA